MCLPFVPLFLYSRIVTDLFGSSPSAFCPRACKRPGKFAEWEIETTVQCPLWDDTRTWLLSSLPRFSDPLISLKTPQILRCPRTYNWLDGNKSESFFSWNNSVRMWYYRVCRCKVGQDRTMAGRNSAIINPLHSHGDIIFYLRSCFVESYSIFFQSHLFFENKSRIKTK